VSTKNKIWDEKGSLRERSVREKYVQKEVFTKGGKLRKPRRGTNSFEGTIWKSGQEKRNATGEEDKFEK